MISIHKGWDTGSRSDSTLGDLCIKSKEKKTKQIKTKSTKFGRVTCF